MKSALAAFAIAFVVVVLLTPVVRGFARRIGAVDGTGGRRVHARETPRLGGLAILFAFFVPLGVLLLLETSVARLYFAAPERVVGVAVGGLAVAAVGVLDDLRGVRAWQKLAVQVLAALLAYYCGYQINSVSLPGLGRIEMGVFGAPVTVLWIVGVINALNLIDGLDGLAGGVALIACVTNLAVGYLHDAPLVLLLSGALGGAVLGFLLFNFNPASIFMGDSGSMFLGFVLATSSLLGSSAKTSTTVAILVPVISLGLPIMDTLLAMLRRFLERRSIFSSDRGHIHHRLLDRGLTQRRAVFVLYGLSVLMAMAAIAVAAGRSWEIALALTGLAVVSGLALRSMGYVEDLRRGRRRVAGGETRLAEGLRKLVPPLLRRLAEVGSPDELRAALERFADEAGVYRLDLTGVDGPAPWATSFVGTRLHGVGRNRDLVRARYSLAPAAAALEVSWASESGHVQAREDALLQLVADGCEAGVRRLASSGPRSDGPTAAVAASPRETPTLPGGAARRQPELPS